MKLLNNKGKIIYTDDTGFSLQLINGKTCLVGDDYMFGVTENGERVRLTPSMNDNSNLYNLEYYQQQKYDSYHWVQSTETIDWDSVPPSIRADDTYNFKSLNPSLILVLILSAFIVFGAFRRR